MLTKWQFGKIMQHRLLGRFESPFKMTLFSIFNRMIRQTWFLLAENIFAFE